MKTMGIQELNKLERCTELFTLILIATLDMAENKEQEEFDNSFRWKDRYGSKHRPKDMTTKHLFYTWLMIWNHSVPARYNIWFRNKYLFMDYYTNDYMQAAFGAIYRELKSRIDLGYKSQSVIKKIEAFLALHPELEEIKIK